jgi:hypothetical protein
MICWQTPFKPHSHLSEKMLCCWKNVEKASCTFAEEHAKGRQSAAATLSSGAASCRSRPSFDEVLVVHSFGRLWALAGLGEGWMSVGR